MFGLFKKKPTDPFEAMLDDLGQAAKLIEQAAKERDELSAAMKGTAAVSGIIKSAGANYGLKVQPNTVFSIFLSVVKSEDFDRIIEMVREMGGSLGKVSKPNLKGALLMFWFQGDG